MKTKNHPQFLNHQRMQQIFNIIIIIIFNYLFCTVKMKKTQPIAKEQKKDKSSSFSIDCSKPVEDKVFITSNFAEYLRQRIKVNGKTGKLGDQIKISDDGAKVSVNSTSAFSKRYLKYLTKKYLKKHSLRQFLYVIAKDKKTYEIKYFNIQQDEAAQE